ncbi:hypothetical protein ACF1AE_25555 [Streptomyces sp. NPDC014986]|uniref:hypothetical protein n=1 Tax=Streptomyces sp. NPDC014986 TaxID=3364934 RepID=UPI003701DDE3
MAGRSVPTHAANNSPRACPTCQGTGGHTITTRSNGKTAQSWQRCDDCKGTGTQGGGI